MTEDTAFLRSARARLAYLSEAIAQLSWEIGELHKQAGTRAMKLSKLLRIYQKVEAQVATTKKYVGRKK